MGTDKRTRKKENRRLRQDRDAKSFQRQKMRKNIIRILVVLGIIVTCITEGAVYTAVVTTNKGEFAIVLDAEKAPLAVNNFVTLARYKYFDGTVCHRAIPGFVVQCGDPTASGSGDPGYSFADELPQAGEYVIGSIAMANSGPNTNGSQFFIITGSEGAQLPPNYTLFGQVSDGLETTVPALDAAANPDPAANGVPPLEELQIISVVIAES